MRMEGGGGGGGAGVGGCLGLGHGGEAQIKGTHTHGGRYVQYNVYGNLFEVSAKYVPPIRPVGRGACGIIWCVPVAVHARRPSLLSASSFLSGHVDRSATGLLFFLFFFFFLEAFDLLTLVPKICMLEQPASSCLLGQGFAIALVAVRRLSKKQRPSQLRTNTFCIY